MKRHKLYLSIVGVALATCGLLLIPWAIMMFTGTFRWSVSDFVLVGMLLFSTGLSLVLILRTTGDIMYRIALGSTLLTALFMVWANLGVGLIGAGPNPGNLMYIGVLAVVIVGAIRSGFRPAGMERTLYAAALTVLVIAAIALVTGMQHYPGSSVLEIIGVNGLFAALYALSGLLFRFAADEPTAEGGMVEGVSRES